MPAKKYNRKIAVEKRLEVILDRKDINKATPVTLENIRSGKHEIQLITSLLTEKKIEPKKYIVFKVLLDGRNSKDINFGKLFGEDNCHGETYNIYYMAGHFYVEGDLNSKHKLDCMMEEGTAAYLERTFQSSV